jgi:hypothetical protein
MPPDGQSIKSWIDEADRTLASRESRYELQRTEISRWTGTAPSSACRESQPRAA